MILDIDKYVVKTFEETKFKRDKRFLAVELWIVSDGENRNRSFFTYDSLVKAVEKFKMVSLSAKYEKHKDDFKGHEVVYRGQDEDGWAEYDYIEQPIGFIPDTANVRIVEDGGKNWLVADAVVWAERNRKIAKLLEKRKINKISMEVIADEMETIDGIDIINDFTPLTVTFLGQDRMTGIANAKSILKEEFSVFNEKLMLAFEQEPEYGTGNRISLDLKKSSVSFDEWGDVDKDELRKNILAAENYEQLVRACYMLIEEGWEDSPSTKLGYPVCQLKGGKLVYNRYGVASARGFLERNKNEDYYNKVNSRLVKVEKKIGVWREYGNISFEGGGVLSEKIRAILAEQFGNDLISVGENFVCFAKKDDDGLKFVSKKFQIEPVEKEGEDEIEDENLLMEEDECEANLAFEVDGVSVEANEIKNYIAKMFGQIAELNTQLEAVTAEKETLRADFESMKTKVDEMETKNKEYEALQFALELNEVVEKYSAKLGEKSADWFEKAKSYESVDALEKDILVFIVNETVPQETFKGNVSNTKKPTGYNAWDILRENAK